MAETTKKPLVTFAVASCNQEQFVREAVEAALAQTYSPLQVILSDDCSDDGSFEIMRQMAEAYRGPHSIVLNRNPKRRITGGHFNQIVSLARGDLIVIAAADDISLRHRSEVMLEAWQQSEYQATSIHSGFIQIDQGSKEIPPVCDYDRPNEEGRIVEQKADPLTFLRTHRPSMIGATHAFSPAFYRLFGDLIEDSIHEDDVLLFRTLLAGRLFYVSEPLVKYRAHGNNVFLTLPERSLDMSRLAEEEMRIRRSFGNRVRMYDGFRVDLEKARRLGLVGEKEGDEIADEITRLRNRYLLKCQFLDSGLLGKFSILRQLRKEGLEAFEITYLKRRLIPRAILLWVRMIRNFALRVLSRVARSWQM